MTEHGIESDEVYRQALGIVSILVNFDPAPGSPDGDRLVALVQLIEQYGAPFMQELRHVSR